MKSISDSEARRCIIICAPRKSSILKALLRLKEKTFRWVYLGEDISQATALEIICGSRGQRLEIGDKLQEVAGSLRQAYIDYIGKQSIANNSLMWWASCLSDKNPWFSRSFLYTCYVRLCQVIIDSGGHENLIFIGENRVIREGIAENIIGLSDYEIQQINTPVLDISGAFAATAKSTRIKSIYLVLTIRNWLLARQYRLKISTDNLSQDNRGLTLLYNWVDANSFSDKGEYRDNYFGQLAHHLGSKGKKVVIIPHIVYMNEYSQILKKIKKSLGHFLLPESYLTIWDVCSVFFRTLFRFREKWVYPPLDGIKIDGIVVYDLYKYRGNFDLFYNLLLYKTIKRWQRAGIPIETFIYPFENHMWEKVYCLGIRKYFPSAKIIGYQHSTVPKMLLNYFFSGQELPVLPFPDKVITTGKYTEKLLKGAGYDPLKVVCGGAIRYESMLKKTVIPMKRDITNPVILVTTPVDINESIELVRKILKAFGQFKHCKIVFKFHPRRPYEVIAEKDEGLKSLPEHFIISDKPSADLLQDSHLLIYTSATTCIEALHLGVPVLHIKSDYTIDRDNLADFPSSIRESVSTPDDIVKATDGILNIDEKELLRKRQLWAEVVAEMFGPVNENTFDLFL